ncbi:MAG: rRNA adenine N-6-methyltransferase family protein, partial [Pelagibacteraceae bacterium]|nr:rRNA adenine N-6-methyltransferase family protein [Pelagibacteraceae bacterium]
YVVAYMISCLKLKKTDKVLEIGTGTGYQTAILSYLCKEVCTIEIYNKLLDQAKKRILKLNLKNINFILGNGTEGWNAGVLFDAIIVSAASEIIPDKLLKNLKNHGCLIMPKKKSLDIQKLLLIKKNNETYFEKELCSVKFVPLLNDNIE